MQLGSPKDSVTGCSLPVGLGASVSGSNISLKGFLGQFIMKECFWCNFVKCNVRSALQDKVLPLETQRKERGTHYGIMFIPRAHGVPYLKGTEFGTALGVKCFIDLQGK